MTLLTGKPRSSPSFAQESAFTLIELMLVLGLLLIVIGISFPSLKNFFRGRALDSEARRFLSLTRYAQSRAAAEGLPMVLWIDPQDRTYGLQAEAGFLDLDRKALVYDLDETLTVEVSTPPATPATTLLGSRQRAAVQNSNLPAIRINAEGYLEDTCPETIVFHQGDSDAEQNVWITQTGNRLNYEISANPPALSRR